MENQIIDSLICARIEHLMYPVVSKTVARETCEVVSVYGNG